MVLNMSCKFEKSTYSTLASRGVMRKSVHTAAVAAAAEAYSFVIHCIHRMPSGGHNKMSHYVLSTHLLVNQLSLNPWEAHSNLP